MNLVSDSDMDLRTLFDGFGVEVPQREVADITTESRSVSRDGLFLACRGSTHHGLEFVDQVLAARPSAIAWEPDADVRAPVLPPDVCGFAVPDLGHRLGEIANRFFATPSAALAVTGITGTNGKTTTAWLVTQALGKLGESARLHGHARSWTGRRAASGGGDHAGLHHACTGSCVNWPMPVPGMRCSKCLRTRSISTASTACASVPSPSAT